jgi:hypothetical protein
MTWVQCGFQHQRRNGADQNDLRHARGRVTADVADHFASQCRVADMDGIVQIERSDEFGDVVAYVSMSLPVPRLARAAVAASDDARNPRLARKNVRSSQTPTFSGNPG